MGGRTVGSSAVVSAIVVDAAINAVLVGVQTFGSPVLGLLVDVGEVGCAVSVCLAVDEEDASVYLRFSPVARRLACGE